MSKNLIDATTLQQNALNLITPFLDNKTLYDYRYMPKKLTDVTVCNGML